MNPELLRLLGEAGVTGPVGWRDVIMLYNYAPVPPPVAPVRDAHWNRGFNLAILSNGRPEHFAKVRPADDPVVARESAIRTCLAGDWHAGVSVTPCRVAKSDRIAVQVSPFLRGPHYGGVVVGQSTADYVATLRNVFHGMSALADRALRECPFIHYDAPTISLAAAATENIAFLAPLAELSEREHAALLAPVIAAGDVRVRPQHGDFWWQNLVMVDGKLWAIDFDGYGDVRIPLFDDITLMATTAGLRAGGAVEGVKRLLSSEEEGRACRTLLTERAAAESLVEDQLDGALVYYLSNMAATVHRRGGFGFSAPHIAAVRFAAQRLAETGHLLPAHLGGGGNGNSAASGGGPRPASRDRLLAVAAMPVLPVRNGYSLRVSNLVRALAKHWDVTLVAPIGATPARDLEALGVRRVVPMPLFRGWEAPLTDDDRRALREQINAIIAEEHPRAAMVWADAEAAMLDNPAFPPAVLDRLDCEVVMAWRELREAHNVKDRLRAVRAAGQWARRERRYVRSAAATIVDGEIDARMLRKISGRNSIHVISSGVEMPNPAGLSEEDPRPTVAFTGNMSFGPNVEGARRFIQSVWPAIRRDVASARLVLAGRTPAADIMALGSRDGVEVAADVDDIRDVLRKAWVAIAPVSTGSGIRTKVLEAWSVGRPVVMSTVAASAMHLDSAVSTLVTDDPSRMAKLIVRLLTDRDERLRMGITSHSFVRREYDSWAHSAARITGLLRDASLRRAP